MKRGPPRVQVTVPSKKAQEEELPPWIRMERQHGQQRMSIKVIVDGTEIDDQGYMDEHHLRAAYADLLLAEESVFGKQRPWRRWKDCVYFRDLLKKGIEKVARDGIVHTEEVTTNGRTKEIAKAPAVCCLADGCSYHTRCLTGEDAVNALWGHYNIACSNEEESFRKTKDRRKLVHPTQPMIEQMNYHWQKEAAAAHERSLAAQGFSVDGEKLREPRKAVGLPRAPALLPQQASRKGSGTGGQQRHQRASGAVAQQPLGGQSMSSTTWTRRSLDAEQGARRPAPVGAPVLRDDQQRRRQQHLASSLSIRRPSKAR